MESLKRIFRIGKGPSSSHTMGPQQAAQIFANSHPKAKAFEVTLYGSLAATGKGHMTDVTIKAVLEPIAPRGNRVESRHRTPFPHQRHGVQIF